MTETNFLSRTPQKSKLLAKASSPLRKLGSPAEVAELVCFLLGDESSHITAEKYRIGGGLS
jgi:NAD(P)-dependent dehydrogenase (short-subunit alcohol dehydrogenase family)